VGGLVAIPVTRVPAGNVYRVEGQRRAVWYARYRLADGREVRKRIGPAWTERGRPPAGYYTKRTAQAWLQDVLDRARRGTLPGAVRTGATFADAAAEYLRYIEHDRGRKKTTIQDYRSIIDVHLLPAFGSSRLEDITTASIELWAGGLERQRPSAVPLTARTKSKILVILHGVFARARRVYGLALNPVADVERPPARASGDIEVFSPEEVQALIRAAADDQDAAVYGVAAFSGLRMGELRALLWRDIDFGRRVVRVRGSYAAGALTAPKSGRVRSVPLVDDAATLLARLGHRPSFTGEDDLVFCEAMGEYLADDRLRRRYHAALSTAGLRRLRFHDLRHTFGSLAITKADIVEVQAWMGHADVTTTMRYLHYRDRADAAARLGTAFRASAATAT
jgi:integrase